MKKFYSILRPYFIWLVLICISFNCSSPSEEPRPSMRNFILGKSYNIYKGIPSIATQIGEVTFGQQSSTINSITTMKYTSSLTSWSSEGTLKLTNDDPKGDGFYDGATFDFEPTGKPTVFTYVVYNSTNAFRSCPSSNCPWIIGTINLKSTQGPSEELILQLKQ